ncbi:hypothetical protein [Sphingomonas nostoxanthinifaciens]|uniref:hypothetical protein n=1 Tax=Sphingomonas nostoxanthinifaciens TaxID=2872652 RepID=UPI001CC1D2D8|nr:hypothetical protein [Sphingomonas nostoxanthinifaciens]UAK25905.1 hypothetical protein K8P63_07225 [Sphingomonas nostoxanthinifaciens]
MIDVAVIAGLRTFVRITRASLSKLGPGVNAEPNISLSSVVKNIIQNSDDDADGTPAQTGLPAIGAFSGEIGMNHPCIGFAISAIGAAVGSGVGV